MAPSRWDRRKRLTFRTEVRAAAPPPEGVPDLNNLLAAGEGPPVNVELWTVPRLTLANVRVVRPRGTRCPGSRYEQLRSWLRRQALEERQLLGISWDDVEVTPPELIRYDLAAGAPQGIAGGQGVAVREWPSFRIVAASAQGTLARVAHLWDQLYDEWLPRSRFEP